MPFTRSIRKVLSFKNLFRLIIFSFFSLILVCIFINNDKTYQSKWYFNSNKMSYQRIPILNEEKLFPIAFTIMVYKDAHQALRLLRAIYRPNNFYCIHVDLKSDGVWREVKSKWPSYYLNATNIILADTERINVIHSTFSVLEADLLCMKLLLNRFASRWKYLINLTGQEWPLKTNLELVRILRTLNGANLVDKIEMNPNYMPDQSKKPPHGVKIWKGSVHVVLIFDFVKFMLYDKKSLEILQYIKDNIIVPDEAYFSTLNHNPILKAPGSYSGNITLHPQRYPIIIRLKYWEGHSNVCHGEFERGICIWGIGDLSTIISPNRNLFVNKFIMDINGDVLNIVEEWFWTRQSDVYAHPNRYSDMS